MKATAFVIQHQGEDGAAEVAMISHKAIGSAFTIAERKARKLAKRAKKKHPHRHWLQRTWVWIPSQEALDEMNDEPIPF